LHLPEASAPPVADPVRHIALHPWSPAPDAVDAQAHVLSNGTLSVQYDRYGRGPDAIRHGSGDLTPPSDGSPLGPQGALDPRYAEPAS